MAEKKKKKHRIPSSYAPVISGVLATATGLHGRSLKKGLSGLKGNGLKNLQLGGGLGMLAISAPHAIDDTKSMGKEAIEKIARIKPSTLKKIKREGVHFLNGASQNAVGGVVGGLGVLALTTPKKPHKSNEKKASIDFYKEQIEKKSIL